MTENRKLYHLYRELFMQTDRAGELPYEMNELLNDLQWGCLTIKQLIKGVQNGYKYGTKEKFNYNDEYYIYNTSPNNDNFSLVSISEKDLIKYFKSIVSDEEFNSFVRDLALQNI